DVVKIGGPSDALEGGRALTSGDGREKQQQAIGELRADQRSGDARSGLGEDCIDAALAEPAKDRAKVQAAIGARYGREENAGVAQTLRAPRVGVARDEDHRA